MRVWFMRYAVCTSSVCLDWFLRLSHLDIYSNTKQNFDTRRYFFSLLVLPIQTSPKQPWPSLSSSRRDSRGISQASLASPWVWGLTVGQTVVSLWQSPSACSVIQRERDGYQKRYVTLSRNRKRPHESLKQQDARILKAVSCIDSFYLMWMSFDVLIQTVMKYKWDEVAF